MDTFHGIGSVEAPPITPLNSLAFLRQAWGRRSNLRPQLWLWSLSMVPFMGSALWFGPTSPWFARCYVLGLGWGLFCFHWILRGAFLRLSVAARPSNRSVLTGYAAAAAALQLPLLVGALLGQWGPPARPLAVVSFTLPLMGLVFVGLWCCQFFVGVATIEGHGFRRDLRKAVWLLQGNHQEMALSLLLLYLGLNVMLVTVYFALLILVGLPATLWLHWVGYTPLGWGLAIAICVILYLLIGCEMMAAMLSWHVSSYWELRSRLEPLPADQGLQEA